MDVQNIEKFIAIKNNVLAKHNSKWVALAMEKELTIDEMFDNNI